MPLFPPDANPPVSRWRIGFVVLLVAWQVLNVGISHIAPPTSFLTTLFLTDYSGIVLKTLAALTLGYAAVRSRNSPYLPAMALLTSALILGAWSAVLYQQSLDFYRSPEAPWADLINLISYSLICLGILWLPSKNAVFTSQRMLLTDVLIALGAFALLAWEFILLPSQTGNASTSPVLRVLIELGYPVLDVALLTCLLLKFELSRDGPNRLGFRLIATSVILLFLGDTAFGTHTYLQRSDNLLLVAGLLYSFFAIGMIAAGLRFSRAIIAGVDSEEVQDNQIDLSPVSVAMMTAILSALFFEVLLKDEPSKRILLGTGALMCLLLYRQTLTYGLRKKWMEAHEARLQATVDERTNELAKANLKLAQLADLDALTGLPNRRALDRKLNESWHMCARLQQPLSLGIIDIDFFKPYNDNYGHSKGDECLRAVTQLLSGVMRRGTDMIARFGGEEFAVVMPLTGLNDAAKFMEDMRRELDAQRLPHEFSAIADHITISIGVASVQPTGSAKWQTLLENADRMLYRAKETGRNRVAVEEESDLQKVTTDQQSTAKRGTNVVHLPE